LGIYTPLSTARYQADLALRLLESWTDEQVPNRTRNIALAAAFSGYSHVLLGEGMCSAAFDIGPELSRTEIFERAEQRFSRALEAAETAGDNDVASLSRAGRARARLNLGKRAEAAADARLVPDGYVWNASYSGAVGRRENAIFARNVRAGSVTIEAPFRNLQDMDVPDARVAVVDVGRRGADNITPWWQQMKYTAAGSSIPIASWREARLIVAETEGGQTAVDIINLLHARAGIPAFTAADPDAIMQHIILERSRELFLESHHLGDKIRYGLSFTPPAGTPYPPKAGGFYGDMTCFPLPDVERLNNPNIGGRR
jgi:hypothetical protein